MVEVLYKEQRKHFFKFLEEGGLEGAQHPKIMGAGMRTENAQVIINRKNTISHSKQTYTKY